jgi:hypothetical protein
MLGRFNDTLQWTQGRGKLIVAGTLSDCTPGDEVRIEASLSQNGRSVSCNDDFTMPRSGPLAWEMDVSAPFVTGTASGSAVATNRDIPSQTFSWQQPSIGIA